MTARPAAAEELEPGAYTVAAGAEFFAIVDRVLRMPEHRHLREHDARLGWMFRAEPKVQAGRRILGMCHRPRVNGSLSGLFDWMLERLLGEPVDFLIVLDAGFWADASPLEREILVFHELAHAVQAEDQNGAPKFNAATGEPVWALQGHDVEEFNAVVRRYGSHSADLREFLDAAGEGDAAAHLPRIR